MQLALIALTLSLLLRLQNCWSGYSLNVAPLGILTPLPILLAVVAILVLLILTVWKYFRGTKKLATHLSLTLVVLVTFLTFGGFAPNALDGAAYRLNQISPESLVDIHNSLSMIIQEHPQSNGRCFSKGEVRDLQRFDEHYERVRELSRFPLSFCADIEGFTLEWASGLTGGFVYRYFDKASAAQTYLQQMKEMQGQETRTVFDYRTDGYRTVGARGIVHYFPK